VYFEDLQHRIHTWRCAWGTHACRQRHKGLDYLPGPVRMAQLMQGIGEASGSSNM